MENREAVNLKKVLKHRSKSELIQLLVKASMTVEQYKTIADSLQSKLNKLQEPKPEQLEVKEESTKGESK